MFLPFADGALNEPATSARPFTVLGETQRLTDVALCPPLHLEPVPSCSTTRESLHEGFQVSRELALEQHGALQQVLENARVRCHVLPAPVGMPDLCFMRDITSPPLGARSRSGQRPSTGHASLIMSLLMWNG